MEILKELYYGNISEASRIRKYDKKSREKETALYDKIKEMLGDNGEVLDDFIDTMYISIDNDMLETYVNGFKTGALIGLEICNLEL